MVGRPARRATVERAVTVTAAGAVSPAPVRMDAVPPARSVRAATVEDLPSPVPPLVLLVGDEELLVSRGIGAVTAAVRNTDPDVIETERTGSELDGPELHELLGPSLFGDARLLVLRNAQDVKVAALAVLQPYLETPAEGCTVVLQHAGGAKGKALLEAVRKQKALEIPCAKVTRADERADFVRAEVRAAGGRIEPAALAALVDAVGSDLRELAATSAQLVSDSGGTIDVDIVRALQGHALEIADPEEQQVRRHLRRRCERHPLEAAGERLLAVDRHVADRHLAGGNDRG